MVGGGAAPGGVGGGVAPGGAAPGGVPFPPPNNCSRVSSPTHPPKVVIAATFNHFAQVRAGFGAGVGAGPGFGAGASGSGSFGASASLFAVSASALLVASACSCALCASSALAFSCLLDIAVSRNLAAAFSFFLRSFAFSRNVLALMSAICFFSGSFIAPAASSAAAASASALCACALCASALAFCCLWDIAVSLTAFSFFLKSLFRSFAFSRNCLALISALCLVSGSFIAPAAFSAAVAS